jgi:hypothetical protein
MVTLTMFLRKKEQHPKDKGIKFPLRTTSIEEQVSKCLRKKYKE